MMPLSTPRLTHWPLRLAAVIEQARRQPFSWSGHNCATFAADCVAAVSGVSLHQRFADLMGSRLAAVRHSVDIEAHVDAVVGSARRIAVPLAQRGDVLLVPAAAGSALAVCVGEWAACAGPDGLVFMPLKDAQCAWHI